MRKYLIKKGIIALLYMAVAIAMEMTAFAVMRLGVLPSYFIFDLIFITAIGFALFIFPYTVPSIVIGVLLLTAQSVVSAFNINLFLMYGDIFSLDLLDFAGEAAAVATGGFFNYGMVFLFLLFPIGSLIIMITVAALMRGKFAFNRRLTLMIASIFVLTAVGSPSVWYGVKANLTVDTPNNGIIRVNDRDLFDNITYKIAFFRKFGTFALYFKNVFLGKPVGANTEIATHDELVNYLTIGKNTAAAGFEDDSLWGIDRDNNLIVVMMESMDSFLINEKYTPTLYKLKEEGLSFSGYHSQSKTDYSEASVILGSYPSRLNLVSPFVAGVNWDTNTFNTLVTGDFSYSMPNMLKSNGYITSYFHSNSGDYYSRKYTHTKYGFDNTYFLENYPKNSNFDDYGDYVNDKWAMPERMFFDSAIDEILPAEGKFFSFITTINAHGPYLSLYGKRAKAYHERIDDRDFPKLSGSTLNMFKNALAEAMVVDDGVAYLMEQLVVRGLDQNTTLLFYADHNAYSGELSYKIKNSSSTSSDAFNINAFLVSPSGSLQNRDVSKFVTTFDFTVTLFNLLGIEYNPAMYLGYSVFAEEQNVVVSKIGGVLNDKFYTLDGVEITYRAAGATDEDYCKFQQDFLDMKEKWKYIDAQYTNPDIDLGEYL